VPMYSCCPLGSTCACTDANNSANIWLNPVTCQGVTGCPAARQCLGSQCQTCCPVGTTCDPSTGTCLL
jgi:hypothetical protein